MLAQIYLNSSVMKKIKLDQITKYPLEEVAQAHTDIENRKTTGSVILEI